MKKVIINADDFGYSSAVNLGIIQAYKNGLLTSTTLMANMPGCNEAIKLAKENPELGVGGHLVLTCGAPLTKNTTLTDKKGDFFDLKNYKKYRNQFSDDEIFKEWCMQIDYLIEKGLKLTHLDSHHHVHTFPENLEITKKISNKYRLMFRNAYELNKNVELPYQKQVEGFFDLMNYPAIRDTQKPFLSNKKECLKEIEGVLVKITNGVTELMVHPAFVDEQLFFNSSFNIARIKEVSILCNDETRLLFQKLNIDLINYSDL